MKKTVIFSILFACGMSGCMNEKIDPVQKAVKQRHSGYNYDSARAVTAEQIAAILEAGRFAPSSYNDQPWKFIVADKNSNKAAYDKAVAGLVDFNQKWAQAAPVLLVVVADTNSRDGKFNKWAQYDAGAAASYMALQAASLGLMAHQMGGFDEAKLRASFNIPKDFVPMSVMALGYESEAEKKKAVKKERKKLDQIAFDGAWGTSNPKWEN